MKNRACWAAGVGYPRRWVDVMAQHAHGIHGAPARQHDEVAAANRAAFEECFQIIKKCWTEEMLSYQGKFWKIPPGDTPWPLETTAKWGKGVENGVLKSVGVVPKPLQKPHPPIFQPFASSENSIRWCAKPWRRARPSTTTSCTPIPRLCPTGVAAGGR